MVTKTEQCQSVIKNNGEKLFNYQIKKNPLPSDDDPLFSDSQFSIANL